MAPDIKPPPPDQRQTFRWTASGYIPATNKADAALQATNGIRKGLLPLGGTIAGCAVSEHLEMGGEG